MATVYGIEPRATVVAVSPEVGLIEGHDRFMKIIEGAAGLRARLWYLQQGSLTLLRRRWARRPRRTTTTRCPP
ncbi:hypothetical protein [Streptomyces sp. NPDC056949]|uniref:hypothetical protein n=1 Tax=Streptomyces sp. NPDC056949 TaxID=3345976 RepID=UPI00362C992D